MSARDFSFPGGGDASFYDREMKMWIAAEHNLHVLLAANGGRRVAFPRLHHGSLFFAEIATSVQLCCEIARALAEREGREAVFAGGGGSGGDKGGVAVATSAVAVSVAVEA
jgi:hypothetical protein